MLHIKHDSIRHLFMSQKPKLHGICTTCPVHLFRFFIHRPRDFFCVPSAALCQPVASTGEVGIYVCRIHIVELILTVDLTKKSYVLCGQPMVPSRYLIDIGGKERARDFRSQQAQKCSICSSYNSQLTLGEEGLRECGKSSPRPLSLLQAFPFPYEV